MKCIAYLVALVLSFIMTVVVAAPVNTLEDRDVFVPPVVLPNAASVWKIGTQQIVQWYVQKVCPRTDADEHWSRDISHRPDQITNKRGMIVLVKNGRLDIGKRRSFAGAE